MTDQQATESVNEKASSWLDYIPYYTFISNLLDTFDKPFVCLLGIQNFNHGMFIMIGVACSDWFKRYMNLEPNEVTEIMAVVMIPWGTKIIYGLISDNITFCGTKRKSYIVLMGLL